MHPETLHIRQSTGHTAPAPLHLDCPENAGNGRAGKIRKSPVRDADAPAAAARL